MLRSREPKKPSDHDWEVWTRVKNNLLDELYTGVTGYFQIQGHKIANNWAKAYRDNIVLEVGCGLGHHLSFGEHKYNSYIGLDIEYKFVKELYRRFPNVSVVNGDAFTLPFKSSAIDCVLSIYNLEHLRDLSKSLSEIHRVLKPTGELIVGLPAEGGMLYEIGRQLTSKPYVERKYGIDYDAIVRWEHWNTCSEVVDSIKDKFVIRSMYYSPFIIPSLHFNAVVTLRASPI
jgi:SAM-dependent methyltransferase